MLLALSVMTRMPRVVLMDHDATAVMMHPARESRRRRVRLDVLAGRGDVERSSRAKAREEQSQQGAASGCTKFAHVEVFLSGEEATAVCGRSARLALIPAYRGHAAPHS